MNETTKATANNLPEKPLTGVRVLDLTHAYSGPFCTMHLADQGAEVIKIEAPGKGDQSRGWAPFQNGASGYYAYINRNKYGLSLDLKAPEGKAIFRSLVKTADVLVENFRVGTMEKLGLGYDVLKEINPGLIYASVSGFGLEGPLAKQPCYDIIAQAMGGLMSVTGFDRFTKVGTAIADNYSGTYLSLGIVMALYQRSVTGAGRRVDVSMLDTIFSILETGVTDYTIGGKVNGPVGNRDPGIAPFDSFEARDGAFVIACGTDSFWRILCDIMERPDLKEDPRFLTNSQRVACYVDTLKPIVQEWAGRQKLDDVERWMQEAGIPFGRILHMDEVCALEPIRDRHMLWEIEDPEIGEKIRIPGTPIKMRGCADEPQRPAPRLGEHTETILRGSLSLTDEELVELREKHVI